SLGVILTHESYEDGTRQLILDFQPGNVADLGHAPIGGAQVALQGVTRIDPKPLRGTPVKVGINRQVEDPRPFEKSDVLTDQRLERSRESGESGRGEGQYSAGDLNAIDAHEWNRVFNP